MKKIALYMMAFLCLGLASCHDHDSVDTTDIYALAVDPAVSDLDLSTITEETIHLFTPTATVENYTVTLSHNGNEEKISADVQGNVSKTDLNNAVIALAGVTTEPVAISYVVSANMVKVVEGLDTDVIVTSAPALIKVIPQPLGGAYIFDTDPVLFFTGSEYGWGATWNPLVPTHSHENISWIIVYLHANEEFKFAPQKDWGGDFGAITVNDVAGSGIVASEDGSANLKVTKPGWYLVIADAADKAVTIATPNIYLFGNTVGSWDYDDANIFSIPETEDGQFVSPAFKASDEVRMCVKVSGTDWWQTEFVINADNLIDFRGAGDDQARVKVNEGQKCYINFSQGYGSYK